MKYSIITLSLLFLGIYGYSQQSIRISGKVTDGSEPIANVSILVQDSESTTFTDDQGRYAITTKPRKTLIFSYMGMKTIEYITEDVNAVVNMEMVPEIQMLDEVVVSKRRKSQKELEKEYSTNKRLIRTGFGIIDQDRVGYAVRVVDGDDLNPVGIDFLSSLQSFVPGMRINRQIGVSYAENRYGTDALRPLVVLPRRFMTFVNPRPVAYEVDGQLMTDAPIEIPVFNIERIAIISSVSALSKYGQIAAGGLIVINTKGGVFSSASSRYGQSFDQARRWNNLFEEKLGRIDRIPKQKDIQALYAFNTMEEANAFIKEKKLLASVTVYNQMEIANYFLSKWNDEDRYLEIMNKIADKSGHNAVVLKSLAYQLEKNGYNLEALNLYKEIFKIRPSYAQSYRDLAGIHAKVGDTKKSIQYLARYIRYVSLDTLSTAAEGIDSIIFSEYDNLLAKSGISRYDKRVTDPDDKGSVRLLFEWNHGDAEFELQFVNPTNNYYTWQHTLNDTPERIKDEKLKGYSSEQFFVDDTMAGKWRINLKYLGNRSYDPTFLRLSVFYHYGTEYERVETYLHRLTEKNVNYELFNFYNSPIISSAAR